MDRQQTVRQILGAWIAQNYDFIFPRLHDDVVYEVGASAAKSICLTPGVFRGKEKVKQWYASHAVQAAAYEPSAIGILCLTAERPHVSTLEDANANMVTAYGRVGDDVPGELPCMWMSLWHFNGELVDYMLLTADSVGGMERFAVERQQAFVEYQSAELDKARDFIQSLG